MSSDTDTSASTAASGGSTAAAAAGAEHTAYLLGLGDDALIYSHRLAEWLTWAPMLEEDMALANISLDLIGQARSIYTYVGSIDGTNRSEDDLAYWRDEREFHNVHLVEQRRGDFGQEMARMLWFAAYHRALYAALSGSADAQLRAIAVKALKEVRYHFDHAAQWVVRLGDGTDESKARMQEALAWVTPYVAELFSDDAASVAAADAGVGVLPSSLQPQAASAVADVLREATLETPSDSRWHARGGREGVHSEPMGYLLAEMQHLPRSHPGATW
ncbi:MAG: 1,2-phenylacetyl-CoA epoxidase subunit PaaC [Dermatophilaceae bacterium]